MATSISFMDSDELELAGPGQRSGEGADSVIPYLLESLATRPAPLIPAEHHQKEHKPVTSLAEEGVDVPMRDRQNERQPERDFWVAKWMVPEDAPMGIVRYTVTAKDPQGRTGEFKPFEVQASQITIIP